MDKKYLIACWVIIYLVAGILSPCFSETINVILNEQGASDFAKQLKKQGIVMPEDGINEIYKVDINNDGSDEYILTNIDGSGQYFDIIAIYKKDDEKIKDIYDEIKIPLRRLIRDSEKETYDLEEGYVGFMNGSLILEKDKQQVLFSILERSEAHPSPWAYKFLWNKNGIQLISNGALTKGK